MGGMSSSNTGMKLAISQLINQSINQSINIRLLRQDKIQTNNSKQKGNTVSKKKARLDDKPEN